MPFRRRGFAGFRRRRRFGGRRMRRTKTRIVRTVFEVEQTSAFSLVPGAGNLGAATTYVGGLPVYLVNGSGAQAVMYAITPNLNFLFTLTGVSNYAAVSALYDFFRLDKIEYKFVPQVKVDRAVTVTNVPGIYNFTDWPGQDDVITYIDRDGWSPMVAVNGIPNVVSPANGDMTQLVQNKEGARRHKAWTTIRRRFVPVNLGLVATGTAAYSSATAQVGFRKKASWSPIANSQAWNGQLIIAFPYWGNNQAPSAANANQQPEALYSINNTWFISMRAPLYG